MKGIKLSKLSSLKLSNVILDILIFIFAIILLFSIYNVVQVKILGNEYSSFFGITLFEVKTGSMEDAISPGDWIIVKSDNNYELDDVVTFIEGDDYITHRIVEKYDNGNQSTFVTKGDANTSEDPAITQNQIIGKVMMTLPFFGILRVTIFNPWVLIFLLITIYLFNLNSKKEEDVKVLKVVKNLISKVKGIKNKTNLDLFESDSDQKSFDIIGTKPELKDYEEKLENYNSGLDVDDDDYDEEYEEKLITEKKYEENETDEDEYGEDESEKDLNKTMFFRIISVDNEDTTLEELNLTKAEEEVVKEEIEKETVKEELEATEEVEEKQEFVEVNINDEEQKLTLDTIFNKAENKKSKGIIARTIAIKENELSLIVKEILQDNKMQANEASIKKGLIKSYLESKYYNIFSESVAKGDKKKTSIRFVTDSDSDIITEKNGFNKSTKERAKKVIARISKALDEDSNILLKSYSGNDKSFDKKLKKYANLIVLIAKLEYLENSSKDIKGKRNLYARELIKYFTAYDLEIENIDNVIKEIMNVQKVHNQATKFFLNRLNTELFEVIYDSLKTRKNKYVVSLKHNINFSQVYSDDVIKKTYQEGVVAEDKLNVLLTLLQARLSADMLNGDFINEYVVMLPNSLCEKESKFDRLFKQNNNEYAKKNIIFLVPYDNFMKLSVIIKKLRQNGYRISAYIDNTTKFISKSKTSIALAEFIFIDKSVKDISSLEKVITDNFKEKIIKEDFISKFSNLRSGE